MASYIVSMKPPKLLIDCSGIHRNLLFVSALSLESHNAINSGIQRIVAAAPYVDTWMDLSTTLSVENVAGQNELSVSPLGTQSLGLGIPAVLGGTNSLFMSE